MDCFDCDGDGDGDWDDCLLAAAAAAAPPRSMLELVAELPLELNLEQLLGDSVSISTLEILSLITFLGRTWDLEELILAS